MNDIIYGIHAVQSLLILDPQCFLNVYLLKENKNKRLQQLFKKLEYAGVSIRIVSRQFLDKKVNGATHQGIVAYVKSKRRFKETDLKKILIHKTIPFHLILDNITDPHNLGACIRCADAAGVHSVIVPRHRAAPLNAIAKKVACGAAETVPLIRVTNLSRTLRMLKEHNVLIVGTVCNMNRNIYQSKLTGPLALIMGSEDKGIRRLVREHCDELISIPMVGVVSSLNVSVAVGICLYEVVRQRLNKN